MQLQIVIKAHVWPCISMLSVELVPIPTVLDQKTGGNKTQKPPLNTDQVDYILRDRVSALYIWLSHQKGPYAEL